MTRYNTNLASEFYVLSVLYRLGIDATLTLGNKKSVDIFVLNEARDVLTIDVKGVAGKYDWPVDNIRKTSDYTHFVVFISYEGEIENPNILPNVWIIPYEEVNKFTKQYKSRKDVSRALLAKNGEAYHNAWNLLK